MSPESAQHQYYPITGIPVEGSDPSAGINRKVPVRQDIDEWSNKPRNKRQVDLFILALEKFQKRDPKEKLSYFQIAGIHGHPFKRWDDPTSEPLENGYCAHSNILFPIWHRPYMLLYEQVIYEIMIQDIIPNFAKGQQPIWKKEADEWRLPYWDWARTNRVPELAKYPTITVPKYNGPGVNRIDNPLFQFRNPTEKRMISEGVGADNPWESPEYNEDDMKFGSSIGTSRWPDEQDRKPESEAWRHGVVNNYKVADKFQNPTWTEEKKKYGPAAEMVFRLLTVPMEYITFASTKPWSTSEDKNKGGANQEVDKDINLEALHNAIHGWTGGEGGHMANVPVAAFDPLFWLHHCNIDRLWALWQALNPDKWLDDPSVPADETFMNEYYQEERVTPEVSLRPFRGDTKGTYVTPQDVRYTANLGYSYVDLQPWDEKYNQKGKFDRDLFIKDLNKRINTLYGLSRSLALDPRFSAIDGIVNIEGGLLLPDYAFSIRFLKYGLGGDPFWIRLYLAQEEGEKIPVLDLIAEVYNFSQRPHTDNGNCGNCKKLQKQKVKSTAYIAITPVLLNLLRSGKKLGSLTKGHVLEYLRKHVYWSVFKGGRELAQSEVRKLELEIVGSTNDGKHYEDPARLPDYENFEAQPAISGGAEGAFNPALQNTIREPPPLKIVPPQAGLDLGQTLQFKQLLGTNSVIIIKSLGVDLAQPSASGPDMTQLSITNTNGDIVFHISIRRGQGEIIFNAKLARGQWGPEVKVPLDKRFKDKEEATILIHDQGEGYEVFIDWTHVVWFEKRIKETTPKAIQYDLYPGQEATSVLAPALQVSTYPSMKALFFSEG